MAMILCSECGTEVSDQAPTCPKCGVPQQLKAINPPAKAAKNIAGLVVGGAVVIAVCVGGLLFLSAQEQEEMRSQLADDAAASEAAAAQQAQNEEMARRVADDAARRAAEDARIREAEERQAAERAEKQGVASNPGSVLNASGFETLDKGVINDYRQLTKVTILNRSKYALRRISGQVEWLTSDGGFVGASPFDVEGSIPAGDTKTFSVSAGTLRSGTIQGSASSLRLRYNPAEIVE